MERVNRWIAAAHLEVAVKKLLAVIAVCVVAWSVVTRHRTQTPMAVPSRAAASVPVSEALATDASVYSPSESQSLPVTPPQPEYACDGRVYCSQMTSCEEAKYFLAHCPGVKMDGDNDGIPCEREFCGS